MDMPETKLGTVEYSDGSVFFTASELYTLQDILQSYAELQEQVYNHPEDPATLFTQTQRKLFRRFDVVSIRRNRPIY
jgi:hypothetical protein